MLDSKYLRYDLEGISQKLATRGYDLDTDHFVQLEKKRKVLQEKVETLQHRANEVAKQLGQMKRTAVKNVGSDPSMTRLLVESRDIKAQLSEHKEAFQVVRQQLEAFLLTIPNLPDATVPLGTSAENNIVLRHGGTIPSFGFVAKDHIALTTDGNPLNQIDFESAAKIAGSRFVVLKGLLAKLQRALIQFMLDIHTEIHGYEEVSVPYLVNEASLQATGQLPLFSEDLFALKSPHDFYLIPTGEVPVTNLARDKIFDERELPKKYVAYTSCFRSEAGSYGRDVKGMIRQHQFEKVELVQFVKATQAEVALESLTQSAEAILQRLELPYRVVMLCTGDLGFASTKTYDIEVWLPGQSAFREISSCSHMGDFQARRLKARWRCPKTKQTEWIHTLNGSGLAVGRTLVAILENYQQADGSIRIPKALQAYMGKISLISLTQ